MLSDVGIDYRCFKLDDFVLSSRGNSESSAHK